MIVVRNVLRTPDNKVLLGLRSDRPLWELPGGKVESSESFVEAARREVWEETGIMPPGSPVFLGSWSSAKKKKTLFYLWNTIDERPTTLSDEHEDLHWFDKSGQRTVELAPSTEFCLLCLMGEKAERRWRADTELVET